MPGLDLTLSTVSDIEGFVCASPIEWRCRRWRRGGGRGHGPTDPLNFFPMFFFHFFSIPVLRSPNRVKALAEGRWARMWCPVLVSTAVEVSQQGDRGCGILRLCLRRWSAKERFESCCITSFNRPMLPI
ncbi:hypothetical protein COCNU_13G005730 [Cocos nucifera]|uniref:Uncharacterized protein n=1 Tax=Cocos nucifera TaxID=13894 RepID=A0A8K0NBK1_COCNU|nr:hypothetical protein COCNU_13G005730 [Cocos nucifera]